MSTTELDEAGIEPAINGHLPADPELKTYRGKTLEELLPKIREDLGPDALVVRQRDGLMGGIGGFFQQQFVEVEARPGHPRIDVYDEPPATDDFAAKLIAAAREAEADAPASDDADPAPAVPDLLAALGLPAALAEEPATAVIPSMPVAEPEPEPEPEPVPAPAAAQAPKPAAKPRAARKPAARKPAQPKARKPRAVKAPAERPSVAPAASGADALAAVLVTHGLGARLAGELVAGGDPRAAVRRALARRIPVVPPRRATAYATAFVGAPGAGKTRCAAALASAYARTGGVPVLCLALAAEDAGAELTRLLSGTGVPVEAVATGAAARARLERAPADTLVVVDVPAVSPVDASDVARLARQLTPLALDEVQLAVPATMSAAAARELQERLAPLKPSGIALTHADATRHIGAVVELACTTRLPLGWVAERDGLVPADPTAIAERLLP
jgi:flagellar biosynthesis GTPase FlhF